MISLELTYGPRTHQIIVLNKWDIEGYETVKCRYATQDDVGKLLEFDDGSEWYSPIVAVAGSAVRTQAGVFNKGDYVCMSRVKCPGTQYSGLYRSDQHLLVFPPTRKEIERVEEFKNKQFSGKLSKRELVMTIEELREKSLAKKIDASWIIDKLYGEATSASNKGFERLEAIKILARVNGVEVAGLQPMGNGPQALFGNLNVVTIQAQRRGERTLQRQLQSAIDVVCTVKESSDDSQPE